MSVSPERVAHAANLLVCIGGVATATGLISGAGAAIGGYLSWREVRKRLPDAARPLAEELSEGLTGKLAGMEPDTAALIPQMIEASLPDPETIVDSGLDAAVLMDRMVEALTFHEHRLDGNVAAFRRIVTPMLARLLDDRAFVDALAPALQRAVLQHMRDMAEAVAGLSTAYGSLAASLDDLRNLKRLELEALAMKFGLDPGSEDSDAALRQALGNKAEDFRRLQAQIEAIPETLRQLSNLKGAAQEAFAAGRMDEVEDLLGRVQTVELEEAAKTAELRAETALLRGRVDQAFRLLSAAAESFGAVDDLEPARRRIARYAGLLYDNGLRYGGGGIARAAEMTRAALSSVEREAEPRLWAVAQNKLGNALANQGIRAGGAEGSALLAEAVGAYRAALEVYTREAHPANWAVGLGNLGAVLREQGIRADGAEGTALLAEAVAAYRAALEVCTRAAHPEDWATTQHNLGNALADQGTRAASVEGIALLAEAVDIYRAALEVFTRAEYPVNWAMTQNNLGAALAGQGTRTGGAEGMALLTEAALTYRAALEVYTRAAHPVAWAGTQNNLGIALSEQGTRTGGAEGSAFLAEAVAAYRKALEVYTRADHPVTWSATQNNLGCALADQGTRTGGAEGMALLAEAALACRAALEVRTRADHPVDWAMTQENLALAEQALAGLAAGATRAAHLRAALAHVEAALEVYDPEHMAQGFERAVVLRGRLQAALDDG